MAISTFVLLVAGISAAIGAVVRRWGLLVVLLLLWIALEIYLALAGQLHSDEDTPTTLVTMSFLFFLLPAELGAAMGTAAGKVVRRAQRHRHATP
jgi:hypothetical protein